MADETRGWRRGVLAIGFGVGGLLLFAMAYASIGGVTFLRATGRYGTPRSWSVVPIDSPTVQVIGAIVCATIGAVLMWLAYKAIRGQRAFRRGGER